MDPMWDWGYRLSRKCIRVNFQLTPVLELNFLTTASWFHITTQHLAGSANIPSDFTSHNAPTCEEPHCQICTFIHCTEEYVVHKASVADIVGGQVCLPYTSHSSWKFTQMDVPDLRHVDAICLKVPGHKKLTNIKDIQRYLKYTTIKWDGLLVV